MENQKLTPKETKRAVRNQSAKYIVDLFKDQYRGNIAFPEVSEKDVSRLREKLDACADSWLSDIVNEK